MLDSLYRTCKIKIRQIIDGNKKNESEQPKKDELESITLINCDSSALGIISEQQISEWFNSKELNYHWDLVKHEIENLNLPEMTGGVNPGDQRSLFYLISALKPQKVLEIGTHIGCSTIHIALALKNLNIRNFITVDIRDVNDPIQKPWQEYQSPACPLELIKQLGCQDFTKFTVSKSLDFFKTSQQKFDFIFLDGLHDAYMVYQEIPNALKKLNPGGLILLHDYFPNGKSLWEAYAPIVGPYLAIKRLQQEGANLKAISLGEPPWPTKLGTNITSLAILTRNN
jgi:predicted O-methyltransferase YrrM